MMIAIFLLFSALHFPGEMLADEWRWNEKPTAYKNNNSVAKRFLDDFADDLGRWNGAKIATRRSALDFRYLADDGSEYFRTRYGIEVSGASLQDSYFLDGVLRDLPSWQIAGLKRISIEACPDTLGGYYMGVSGEVHLCAAEMQSDSCTSVWPDYIARRLYIVLHEIGHHIWFVNLPEKVRQEFQSITMQNPVENFAKFYGYAIVYPEELHQLSPRLMHFFSAKIFVTRKP
jgi:hypothetical protein